MKRLQLSDFDALTFDFYGTIVNWEPEILSFLLKWTQDQGLSVPDDSLLEIYDRLRQPIQTERPAWRYPEVLRHTLDAMAQELDCALPSAVRDEFGGIAATHQPFPDSVQTLNALKARGLVLGALSNVDEVSFEKILGRLGVAFDFTVTAQRVGAYKPDKAHFMAALSDLRALGIEKDRVLHVAQSMRADIAPANELGILCVWVNRPGHVFGRRGGGAQSARPTFTVSSLAELLAF